MGRDILRKERFLERRERADSAAEGSSGCMHSGGGGKWDGSATDISRTGISYRRLSTFEAGMAHILA